MHFKFSIIFGALFFTSQLNAQSAREVGVEIKANLNSSHQIELDLAPWANGIYLFQMIDLSGNIQNIKLIKQ